MGTKLSPQPTTKLFDGASIVYGAVSPSIECQRYADESGCFIFTLSGTTAGLTANPTIRVQARMVEGLPWAYVGKFRLNNFATKAELAWCDRRIYPQMRFEISDDTGGFSGADALVLAGLTITSYIIE